MFSWRLGSLPTGLLAAENQSVGLSKLSNIFANPINAPYRFLQDTIVHLHRSAATARFPSVILAILFSVCFYLLLKSWLGKSIALLTSLILVFTPYFIIAGRSATPDIMYFSPILVLAAYSYATRWPGKRLPVILLLLSVVFSLYVPGMFWLIGFMIAYRYTRLREIAFHAELKSKDLLLLLLLALVLLSPLVVGLGSHVSHVKQWLLIPASFMGLGAVVKSWLWAMSAFVFGARSHQDLIIGRLPLLSVAQVALLVFGGYVMWSRLRAELFTILGLYLFITFLSGINNSYGILALALPLLSIVMGLGLRYLYIEWRHVFPVNPLARVFAIGLMSAVVLVHILLGIRYGLVAWPATVVSHQVNVLK